MPDIDTGTLYLWEWTQTIFVLLLMVLLISHSFLIPTNTSSPSPARWTMPNAISFDADFWRMHLWIVNVPGYKKGAKNKLWKTNRCSDGTELGTGFSSLVCKSCTGSSHLISSTDPRFNHLLDLTHFTTQAILKIPFGQGWQKFQAPFGRLEVLWL